MVRLDTTSLSRECAEYSYRKDKDIFRISDISSIDHLVMREFVSGPPRYHFAIKGVR